MQKPMPSQNILTNSPDKISLLGSSSRYILGIAAITLFLGILPSQVHAGGWTKNVGEYYTKIWLRGLVGSSAFLLEKPTESTGGTYRDFSANFYTEIGVHESITLIAHGTPAGFASFSDDRNSKSTGYMGILGAGARWGFLKGKLNMALEVRYGYTSRLGEEAVGKGVARKQPWHYTPVVSSHRFDGELQAGYGFLLGSHGSGWVTLSAGVAQFTRAKLGTTIIGAAQIGIALNMGLVFMLNFNLFHPLQELQEVNVSGAGPTDYAGNGLTISYWFNKNFAVTASMEAIFYAYSNASTPSLVLGIELKN